MLFWKRVRVGHNERVILFRHKRFVKIFGPGDHVFGGLAHTMHEERYSVTAPVFASEWVDYLVKERSIDGSRIETRSAAATKPLDTGTDATAQARNRRVEVWFMPEGASEPK